MAWVGVIRLEGIIWEKKEIRELIDGAKQFNNCEKIEFVDSELQK